MLDLYAHNQKAYENVLMEWERTQRTCVVHATGTGKSLIVAKNILENPDSKHLFLAPSVFIFKELKKHLNKPIKNVTFITYQYLLGADVSLIKDFDYIYLDEFHRAGAEEWSKYLDVVLMQNQNAKILGTSATHIRYLDGNRNIAEEIFDNSIASYLDLGTAIENKIHKVPKYVSAIYNHCDILNEVEFSLRKKKRHKEYDSLKSKKVVWEESTGVDFIVNKHLSLDRKKILVFCKSIEHISVVKNLLTPILTKFYNNQVNFNTLYSLLGEKKISKIFSLFESSKSAEILFCVDMLNEGVHIKNVDTIMMFRDTASPIIYFQQMGRCFASGQKTSPLMFDFVNNFNIKNSINSIQDAFYLNFNKESSLDYRESKKIIVDFYDETLEFQNFINQFRLLKTWEENYDDLVKFVKENKRLPKTRENIWLTNQKSAFKKGLLDKKETQLLLEIDKNIFEDKHSLFWEKSYADLIKFIKENKRLPKNNESGWLSDQRSRFKKSELDTKKIQMLLEIDKNIFENKHSLSWKKNYEDLVKFVKENKRLPESKENYWLCNQKSKFKFGKLSEEQILKLQNIDKNILI